MAALISAAGPPSRSTAPSSPPFSCPRRLRPEPTALRPPQAQGHALLQRDASRYAYRLTQKGVQVALLFLFFHKRLGGPLANSRFHHRPDADHQPVTKREAAYHCADKAIQQMVDLLAA